MFELIWDQALKYDYNVHLQTPERFQRNFLCDSTHKKLVNAFKLQSTETRMDHEVIFKISTTVDININSFHYIGYQSQTTIGQN